MTTADLVGELVVHQEGAGSAACGGGAGLSWLLGTTSSATPPMAAATPSAAITFQLRVRGGVMASSISDDADDRVVEVLGERVWVPDTAGELVTTTGEVIGHHDGIHNFTVGQRKGLGVATGSPLYVLQLRGDQQQVVVGGDDELYSDTLIARDVNWIAIPELDSSIEIQAKIRNKHTPSAALLERASNGDVHVTFREPQRAITPGQAVVFYQDNLVVGGGWIV